MRGEILTELKACRMYKMQSNQEKISADARLTGACCWDCSPLWSAECGSFHLSLSGGPMRSTLSSSPWALLRTSITFFQVSMAVNISPWSLAWMTFLLLAVLTSDTCLCLCMLCADIEGQYLVSRVEWKQKVDGFMVWGASCKICLCCSMRYPLTVLAALTWVLYSSVRLYTTS